LYALVGALLCVSWFVFFNYLSGHQELIETIVEPRFFQKERLRAGVGIVLYAVAGVLGLFVPLLSLVIFLGPTVFYALTSHGIEELPYRVKLSRRRTRAESPPADGSP
jgi:hypothetical protein